ncbi:MAG: hypothetical protein WCC57_09170 [Paracoccaceae bacterium]
MRMIGIVAVLLLGGCVALQGPQRPVAAKLSPEILTVTMSDGTRCATPWAAGTGRMDACGLEWRVEPEGQPNPLRRVFVELTGALGLEGSVTPRATVTLTDASGKGYGFVSPPK